MVSIAQKRLPIKLKKTKMSITGRRKNILQLRQNYFQYNFGFWFLFLINCEQTTYLPVICRCYQIQINQKYMPGRCLCIVILRWWWWCRQRETITDNDKDDFNMLYTKATNSKQDGKQKQKIKLSSTQNEKNVCIVYVYKYKIHIILL